MKVRTTSVRKHKLKTQNPKTLKLKKASRKRGKKINRQTKKYPKRKEHYSYKSRGGNYKDEDWEFLDYDDANDPNDDFKVRVIASENNNEFLRDDDKPAPSFPAHLHSYNPNFVSKSSTSDRPPLFPNHLHAYNPDFIPPTTHKSYSPSAPPAWI
jgi:hypothetical protein